MDKSRFKSFLGIISRANKISCNNIALEKIRNKQAKLVIITEDATARTKKQISQKCHYYEIESIMVLTSEEISHAIGKTETRYISINDTNFAEQVLKLFKE